MTKLMYEKLEGIRQEAPRPNPRWTPWVSLEGLRKNKKGAIFVAEVSEISIRHPFSQTPLPPKPTEYEARKLRAPLVHDYAYLRPHTQFFLWPTRISIW